MATFWIYNDNVGEYRWRLRAVNGRIVADSGEGYNTWHGAMDAINWVKRYVPGADVRGFTRRRLSDLLNQALEVRSE